MRPLRYSINVTVDGCCDHRAFNPAADVHRHAELGIRQADALIFGRTTYQLMESGWRPVVAGDVPDWMDPWMIPFAHTIDAARKYVVSDTLSPGQVDWNATVVRGHELAEVVCALKEGPGQGLVTGGVALPTTLASLGLIDEYEFVVHPTVAGHGPTPLAGLPPLALEPAGRTEFTGGVVATQYRPRRSG